MQTIKLILNKTVETFTHIFTNKASKTQIFYNSDMYDYRENSETLSKLIEYINTLSEYFRYSRNTKYGIAINTDSISSKDIIYLMYIVRNIIHNPNHIIVVTDKNVKNISELSNNIVELLTKLGVKIDE